MGKKFYQIPILEISSVSEKDILTISDNLDGWDSNWVIVLGGKS